MRKGFGYSSLISDPINLATCSFKTDEKKYVKTGV